MAKLKIREVMEEKGISKMELHTHSEVCHATIKRLTNGGEVTMLNLNVIERICKVLDCNIEDIVQLEG